MKRYKSFLDKKLKNDLKIIQLKEELSSLYDLNKLEENKMQYIDKNANNYIIVIREFKKRVNRRRNRIEEIKKEIRQYETL